MAKQSIWSYIFGPQASELSSFAWWKWPLLLILSWFRSLGIVGAALALLSIVANVKGSFDDNASSRQVADLSEKLTQMKGLLEVVKLAVDSRATQLDNVASGAALCDPKQLEAAAADMRKLSKSLVLLLRTYDGTNQGTEAPSAETRPEADDNEGQKKDQSVSQPSPSRRDALRETREGRRVELQDAPPRAISESVGQADRPSPGALTIPTRPLSPVSAETGIRVFNVTLVIGATRDASARVNIPSPRIDELSTMPAGAFATILALPRMSQIQVTHGDGGIVRVGDRVTVDQLQQLSVRVLSDGCGGKTAFSYRVTYGGRHVDGRADIVANWPNATACVPWE